MPTQQYARKAAALVAITRLHVAGELNTHLLPVPRDESSSEEEGSSDDDDDDDDSGTIVARGGTGAEKSKHYYPNKVVCDDCIERLYHFEIPVFRLLLCCNTVVPSPAVTATCMWSSSLLWRLAGSTRHCQTCPRKQHWAY